MKFPIVCLAVMICTSLVLAGDAPTTSPTTQAQFQITIDYSQTPELKDWIETKLRPTLEKWYPMIVAELPSDGFTAPKSCTITLLANYDGVAATSGTQVSVNARWIKQQIPRQKSEAVGAIVHELVHVVQQYGHGSGHHRTPGWLTEGIADYIRWWQYEPAENRRPVRATHGNGQPASYTDSYQTTAAFLYYVVNHYDKDLVVKLNDFARRGEYSADLWKKFTGKTVDELWAEFAKTLAA